MTSLRSVTLNNVLSGRVSARAAVVGSSRAGRGRHARSGRLGLLLRGLRAHRAPLTAGLVLQLTAGVAGIVEPKLAQSAVDHSLSGHLAWSEIVILIALVFGGGFGGAVGGYLIQRVAEDFVRAARRNLVWQFVHATVEASSRQSPGDLLSRLTSDLTVVRISVGQSVSAIAVGAVVVPVGFVAMTVISPLLTLVTLGVIVGAGAVSAVALPVLSRSAKEVQERVGEVSSTVERALGAFRTVKANGAEEREVASSETAVAAAWRAGRRAAKWEAMAGTSAALAVRIAFFAVLGVAGFQLAAKRIDVGSLVAFLFYLVVVSPALTQLITAVGVLQRGAVAYERVHALDSLPTEPVRPNRRPEYCRTASLVFENVTFRYTGHKEPIIENLSLAIPGHGVTALVGSSGAGKTTVLALIERFYEPLHGRILLGGRDIAALPLETLRAMIGYVEQDAPMLAGSLRENLRYGAPNAGDAEIYQALSAARLADYVDRLPEKLDTSVGYRGSTLSGGQRQRLAIARALLRRPRLLLLDEPSSQLDAENESALREVIARVARTTSVIVVAHRLSTVIDADRIVVMTPGRPVRSGTHQDLLAVDPVYRTMVNSQLIANRLAV